jgi:hypothetical protein
MTKRFLQTIEVAPSLAWILPVPVWPSLGLASAPLRKIYTLCNRSQTPIKIQKVGLDPGGDKRLLIVGGSCYMGLILAPQATCTIEIQVSPKAIGSVKQVLSVQHAGHASPLWTELFIAITERGKDTRKPSYLAEETRKMARQRRILEQEGHRHYARVNAREHSDQEPSTSLVAAEEGTLQNNILQNPWLNSQRFDGVDPNLNPEPPLNSEARREFDNERREQEMEKQLRLGNVPRFSSAPKPQGYS